MGLKTTLAKWLIKSTPMDEKYIRALFRTVLHEGTINEIQNKGESYITEGYQGNADVYSIVRRFFSMSTQAKLVLKKYSKDGDNEAINDHELLNFLEMANPQMTYEEFFESYCVYMLATGNNFWYKPLLESGQNKGKTKEIYVLPSNDVEIILGQNKITAPVSGYKLISSEQRFEPYEVYHSKYFNPMFYSDETWFGQSPLQAAANILSKQNEAAKTEGKQFENQGPAYMLFRDGVDQWNTMSDAQKKELEKEINGLTKKGKQGSGTVLKDKFGIIKLGISAADLNIIQSTQDGRRILCNVYQMPVSLFNDSANSTYNNVTTARKAAWTDALIPFNDKYANGLTNFLIKPVDAYKGLYFEMDYSGVEELQDAMSSKVDWMVKARWSANQILQATGKDRIEDPIMDEPIFGRNDVLLSELSLDENMDNKNYGDYK